MLLGSSRLHCLFRAHMCLCLSSLQFKTPEELAVMQYCNDIASAAHVELLRYAKPGECACVCIAGACSCFAAMHCLSGTAEVHTLQCDDCA